MKRFFFLFLVAIAGLTSPSLHAQIVTDLVLYAPPTSEDADHNFITTTSLSEAVDWRILAPGDEAVWVKSPGALPVILPAASVNGGLLKAHGNGVYKFYYIIAGVSYLEELVVE